MSREERRLVERQQRRQEKADEKAKQAQSGKSAMQKATARKNSPTVSERGSVFSRLWTFLKEVRSELKRVSWPTREQMIAFTTVTLITTTALTLFTFAIDQGFNQALLLILEIGT